MCVLFILKYVGVFMCGFFNVWMCVFVVFEIYVCYGFVSRYSTTCLCVFVCV